MTRLTEASVRELLSTITSYNGARSIDAVAKQIMESLREAYANAEEADELRKQLAKRIRKGVGLETQIQELDARLEAAGSPIVFVQAGAFLVGPRTEMMLDQIAPGYPIIFTDDPVRSPAPKLAPPRPTKLHPAEDDGLDEVKG